MNKRINLNGFNFIEIYQLFFFFIYCHRLVQLLNLYTVKFYSLSQWTYFLSESRYTFNSLTWTKNKKKFCETDWIQRNCVINLQGFLLLSKGYLQYIKEHSHFTRKGFEPILTKQLKEIIILCLTFQLVTHPRFV